MIRSSFAICLAILAMSAPQRAGADEVRHTTFPSVLIGAWAPSAEPYQVVDRSSIWKTRPMPRLTNRPGMIRLAIAM